MQMGLQNEPDLTNRRLYGTISSGKQVFVQQGAEGQQARGCESGPVPPKGPGRGAHVPSHRLLRECVEQHQLVLLCDQSTE